MRTLIAASILAVLPALALAQDKPAQANMDWAYPVTPKPEPLDSVHQKQVPGSARKYTQAQIDDPFNPPDWFPDEHPPMPEIVAHGGAKPAGRACAQCHLPSGDGHPESRASPACRRTTSSARWRRSRTASARAFARAT